MAAEEERLMFRTRVLRDLGSTASTTEMRWTNQLLMAVSCTKGAQLPSDPEECTQYSQKRASDGHHQWISDDRRGIDERKSGPCDYKQQTSAKLQTACMHETKGWDKVDTNEEYYCWTERPPVCTGAQAFEALSLHIAECAGPAGSRNI